MKQNKETTPPRTFGLHCGAGLVLLPLTLGCTLGGSFSLQVYSGGIVFRTCSLAVPIPSSSPFISCRLRVDKDESCWLSLCVGRPIQPFTSCRLRVLLMKMSCGSARGCTRGRRLAEVAVERGEVSLQGLFGTVWTVHCFVLARLGPVCSWCVIGRAKVG
jgi:hypothetical protein